MLNRTVPGAVQFATHCSHFAWKIESNREALFDSVPTGCEPTGPTARERGPTGSEGAGPTER